MGGGIEKMWVGVGKKEKKEKNALLVTELLSQTNLVLSSVLNWNSTFVTLYQTWLSKHSLWYLIME